MKFIDRDGQVIRVEGSWHGEVRDLAMNGRLAVEDAHPVVPVPAGLVE